MRRRTIRTPTDIPDARTPRRHYNYTGIYNPREVTNYLRAATPELHRKPLPRDIWRWVHLGLVAPERREDDHDRILLDFEDLITGYAIVLFYEAGLTLAQIDRAERYFRSHFQLVRPFVHETFWYDGGDIFAQNDALLISGTRQGQIAMSFLQEKLKPFSARIEFGPNQIAEAWQPREGVSLRPDIQFGKPCVSGTRIPTGDLWSASQAGQGIGDIARDYGIEEVDVKQAIEWENSLRALSI